MRTEFISSKHKEHKEQLLRRAETRLFYRELLPFSDIEYDYEISNCRIHENNIFIAQLTKHSCQLIELNIGQVVDTHKIEINDGKCISSNIKFNPSLCLCIKRLVSKKKRRFENQDFSLDLAYITKRVIAMGYPSDGIESYYRNSKQQTLEFLHFYHKEGFKIYNLCIEKSRIYTKEYIFGKSITKNPEERKKYKLSLFPIKDHNPPPIKLILEFCVDISIHLHSNPNSVAAIHCKAGKGRSGTMIVCYLIFSELFSNLEDALRHYSKMRSKNNKGVTIPSQIRYITYFEMFLEMNIHKPYTMQIPKIIKSQFMNSLDSNNMIKNYILDDSYFFSPNKFMVKRITLGPVTEKKAMTIIMWDLEMEKLKISYDIYIEKVTLPTQTLDENYYMIIIEISDSAPICSDIKFEIKGYLNFYFWINIWYSLVNNLSSILSSKGFFSENDDSESNDSLATSQSSMKKHRDKILDHKLHVNSSAKIDLKAYFSGLSSTSDLNVYVSKLNVCLTEMKRPQIDKKALLIKLGKYELDKFLDVNEVKDIFSVEVLYELLE